MYKALGTTGYVTISTPSKDSLFHALAFATDRSYRSGKIALEKQEVPSLTAQWESKSSSVESTLEILPVDSEKYVKKMKEQLVSHLALPVFIDSAIPLRYQMLGDTPDDATGKLRKDQKFSSKYLDYIALEYKLQIELVGPDMVARHRTQKIENADRIIILDQDKQYSLLGKLSASNELLLRFPAQ